MAQGHSAPAIRPPAGGSNRLVNQSTASFKIRQRDDVDERDASHRR